MPAGPAGGWRACHAAYALRHIQVSELTTVKTSEIMDRPMSRRIYPKPPIIEALMEFHFDAVVEPRQLAEQLVSKLGEHYDAQITPFDLFEIRAENHQNGGISAAASRQPHMHFLSSGSGLRRVGCGRSALTVHTLAPYPGWESFVDQACEAIDALPDAVADAPIVRMAIRYIDLIRYPTGEPIADYVSVVPPCPEGMPPTVSNYHYVTQATDIDDGTIVQLTVAAAPRSSQEEDALWLDLALSTGLIPGTGFRDANWLPAMERLHTRLRDIFESSITDRARELFQ